MRLRYLVPLPLLGIAIAATGCAPSFTPVEHVPEIVLLRNYEIGEQRSAAVGEPIFRVQQAREEHSHILLADYRMRVGADRTIPHGTRFTTVGQDAEGNTLLSNPELNAAGVRFVISADGQRVGNLWEGARNVAWIENDPPAIGRVADIGNQPGAFTAELIYSGLAGSVVRVAYREYVGNLARPAYSQELQYDLSEERVIAYRSVRIRIHDATNSLIRYEVVDDGGLPWLPAPASLAPVADVVRP